MKTRPDGLARGAEADEVAARVAVADEVAARVAVADGVADRMAGLVPVARAEPFTAAVG